MSSNHPLILSGVGLSEQVVNGGFPAIFPGCPDSEPRRVGRKRNDFSRIEREEETEEEEKVVVDEVEEEEESSSIGVASSSSLSEDEEEEVQSKGKVGAFGSLDSLEESLPIKRGLSNFFSGKSKSFASLSGLSNATRAKDIEKQENPFNKRRRILMAYKIRTASLGSLISASSIASSSSSSLLSPDHTVEEDEEDEDQEEIGEKRKSPLVNHGLFLPL